MFRSLLLSIYLNIYRYYDLLWKFIFSYIGNIFLIYYINDDDIKNITMNYYFGWNLKKFKSGTYYLKIFDANGTNHIAFIGNIELIHKIKITESFENPPKRKRVILLNENNPININLEVLDNYKTNTKHLQSSSISNLKEITKILGLKCSHVTIIETRPFNKITMDVESVDINYLYY